MNYRTFFVANHDAPDQLTQNLLIVLAIAVVLTLGILIVFSVFGTHETTMSVRDFVNLGGVPR